MELSEIHNCKKSQGKIVSITIDKLGVTRCAYCNQVVNYSAFFRFFDVDEMLKEVKKEEK